jgi:hypothetical protein
MVITRNKKPQGFIAILSLLIITTISMIFAMSMLKDGLDNASASLSSIYYENARTNVITCFEDTLLRIKKETAFSGNLDYTITDKDSCSTDIEWFSPQQIKPGVKETLVNLDITGVSNGFIRTYRYELKITKYDVNYADGNLDFMNNIDIISMQEIIP